MLVIEGLTRRFGTKAAVDDVSLEIPAGSFVGVIGRSGASTVMATPRSGAALPADYCGDGENLRVAFGGQEVTRTKPIFWEWQGTRQEPDWWPRLAVRDGDWKLLMTYDRSRVELYSLADDLQPERRNVAADHAAIVNRMAQLALDWKADLPKHASPDCMARGEGAPGAASGKAPRRAGPGGRAGRTQP